MSAKSHKTMIGLFVLGAAFLAVGALAAFGSGMFFTKKYPIIMYFEGSVSGLDVGSPVVFRGVPVGLVKTISIEADPSGLSFSIPVVAEITGSTVNLRLTGKDTNGRTLLAARDQTPEELMKALIEKGLRAQLVTQSFVTGQLAVALDILPDTAPRLSGHDKNDIMEVPTIPSEFEELTRTLKTLPLKELVDRLIGAVEGVERLITAPEMAGIPSKLDKALTSGTLLLDDVRGRVDGLAGNLDKAVREFADLAGNLDQRSEKLAASARKSLESLDLALNEGRATLGKFQKVVNPDSPSVAELNKALGEMAQAARAIRSLADYIERHPEALIQGKGVPPRR